MTIPSSKPGRTLAALTSAVLILVLMAGLSAPDPAYASRSESIASCSINVTLDTETETLSAREVIEYANTTQQPIADLIFHLCLNAFRSPETIYMR